VERGNYLADRAASGIAADIAALYPGALIIKSDIMGAETELVERAEWCLTLKGSPPCTPSLRKAQKMTHNKDYKRTRDTAHADEETLWKDTSVQFAADVWDMKNLS
jgi:hypothetical protein